MSAVADQQKIVKEIQQRPVIIFTVAASEPRTQTTPFLKLESHEFCSSLLLTAVGLFQEGYKNFTLGKDVEKKGQEEGKDERERRASKEGLARKKVVIVFTP